MAHYHVLEMTGAWLLAGAAASTAVVLIATGMCEDLIAIVRDGVAHVGWPRR